MWNQEVILQFSSLYLKGNYIRGKNRSFTNSASEEYICKNNSRVIKDLKTEQKQQQSEILLKGRFTHLLHKGFETSSQTESYTLAWCK